MLKSEAAAYLAGVTSDDEAQASAPTNLHLLTGEVVSASEDGNVRVAVDGMMFSEEDDQSVEIETLGGLEEGDTVTILLAGENGRAMSPLAIGAPGSVDRIVTHILETDELVADKATITDLEAAEARIGDLEADTAEIETLVAGKADISDLNAATARIGDLEADTAAIETLVAGKADISDLNAAKGRIDTLEAHDVTVTGRITAAEAVINNLDANYAQVNMANVNNAWITNGVVKDGAITNAMINSVSANKLTAGTIDASNITVTNLNASNITTGTINGQRIGTGSLSLDKLAEDVYTENEIDGIVSNLQTQIDGAIETWTGTVVPTLQNAPASNWTTNAIKDTHVGDVYFVVNSSSQQNGYNYRFTKSGNTYSWQLIKDSDVTAALSRLSTAEGKITAIETFDSSVSSFMTNTDSELSSVKTRTTNLETRMTDAEGDILEKVDTTTFNTLSQTVDTNSSNITSLTSTVSQKADSSTVSTLTNRVSSVEQNVGGITTRVSSLEDTIETKADGSTVESIASDLSDLEQDVSGFKTTVSSTYATIDTVTGVTTRVSQAESTISQHADAIETKVSKNGVISSINQSSESITIDANRVYIEGAALFTSGRLSQTSLDAAYDANGAAAAANSKEQLIYKSAVTGTSSMQGTLTWVNDVTGAQNTWTAKRPQYDSSYPVLFVATQRQTVGGTVTCTTPQIDETTTVINGGNIITGSVTANKLNAADINASNSLTIGAMTTATQTSVLNSELSDDISDAAKTATNYIYADSNGIKIADANPSTATTYQLQTANKTTFYVSGVDTGEFGSTGARIGPSTSAHVETTGTSTNFYGANGSTNIMQIGQLSGDPAITFGSGSDRYIVDASTSSLANFLMGCYSGSNTRESDFDFIADGKSGTATLSLHSYEVSGKTVDICPNSVTLGTNVDLDLSNGDLTLYNGGSISCGSVDCGGSVIAAGTCTIDAHSLILTSGDVNSTTTLSADTGGTGVYCRELTGSGNIGYIRSYGRSGADRKRGLQIGGHNIDNSAWNMLYLLTDKDGKRVVQVSESAPWREALELGKTEKSTPSAVSLTSSTWATLGSITLGVGVWSVVVSTWFESNASGRRAMYFGTSSTGSSIAVGADASFTQAPASGGASKYSTSAIVEPTASTTYYCRGYQTSGANLNAQCYLHAVRIK